LTRCGVYRVDHSLGLWSVRWHPDSGWRDRSGPPTEAEARPHEFFARRQRCWVGLTAVISMPLALR